MCMLHFLLQPCFFVPIPPVSYQLIFSFGGLVRTFFLYGASSAYDLVAHALLNAGLIPKEQRPAASAFSIALSPNYLAEAM